MARIVKCPTCRRDVPWRDDSLYKPFCSERCKQIDLGAWASGSYVIPGEPAHLEDEPRDPWRSRDTEG